MKRTIAIIIILILLVSTFQSLMVIGPITGKVTTFSDSEASKLAEFQSGENFKLIGNISIPKRAVITNASFNVSVISNLLDEYPKDIFVDIGDDGKYEWAFQGAGYGQLGQQRYFINNRSSLFLLIY